MSKRLWIDLENSPHVPLFEPIVKELRDEGMAILLTARDFAQTKDLLATYHLPAALVGGEYGRHTLKKALGLTRRAWALRRIAAGFHPDLFISHGSRGGLLAAVSLRVRALTLYDYEGANVRLFNRLSHFILTPEALTADALRPLGLSPEKHLTYPGLKEEVYLCGNYPHVDRRTESKITVGIRPPSETAHYRSDESGRLFESILSLLEPRKDIQVVLVPRTKHQIRQLISRAAATSFAVQTEPQETRRVFESLDLFIGGGGTMNREAAVLGLPVATIFKGQLGAVDASLIRSGKMNAINEAKDILPLLVRRTSTLGCSESQTKQVILATIRSVLAEAGGATSSS